MKTYWGSGGIAPRILNLGNRRRWSSLFPGRFTLEKRSPGFDSRDLKEAIIEDLAAKWR
jgi:hypothetical protein